VSLERTQLFISQLHLHTLHVRTLLHQWTACHHIGPLDVGRSHSKDMRMLLAEALAARKDTIKEIEELSRRLTAAAVRYEDQPAPVDDPVRVDAELTRALDRLQALAVRINLANNETRLSFDGRELTMMEAVALRERLVLEAKARRAAVDAVEHALGAGKSR
jgi:hypothetical protein